MAQGRSANQQKFPLWWALAPFGRIGHALGFRWRFWWTLPIPYHPLVPVLVVLGPLVLLVWGSARVLSGAPAPISWPTFLIAGLVLVIPLSIPIVNMALMVLRVQFLQGICFLVAMLLLTVELATGRAVQWLAVLPILYFATYLWHLVSSRAALAQFRRQAAAFRPVVLAGRPVALRGEQVWNEAHALLNSGATNVACCDDAERKGSVSLAGNTALHVGPDAGRRLRAMLPKPLRPAGWRLIADTILQVPGLVAEPEVKVAWKQMPQRPNGPSGRVLSISDGADCQELFVGRASAVMPIPLFFLFYMVAWSGGRSFWVAGFWRGKTQPIGPAGSGGGTIPALFAIPDPPVQPVDAEPWIAQLALAQDAMLADARADLLQYLAGATRWPKDIRRLQVRPETLAGLGSSLCDAIDRAKEQRNEAAAKFGAELLALIGEEEFRSLEARLLSILGSRILALRWELTPDLDLAPLPKQCPRFGNQAGFGLMEKVPQLWERLGELGPKSARVTELLIGEIGERPMLVKARDRFVERGIALPVI